MVKIDCISRLEVVCKILLWFFPNSYWPYIHSIKTQYLTYYQLWYLFLYFWILHSKSVILLVLCLVFVCGFPPLFLSGLNEIFNKSRRWFSYILVTIYVCLNDKPFNLITYFLCWNIFLKYGLCPHGDNQPHQGVKDGCIYLKTLWYLISYNDWNKRNGRKHNSLITIKYGK